MYDNPSETHKNRLAPPMVAVKIHYLNNNITKEDFKKTFGILLSFQLKIKVKCMVLLKDLV